MKDVLLGEWNAELIRFSSKTKQKTSDFFSFHFKETDQPFIIRSQLWEGDYPLLQENETDDRESFAEVEIEFSNQQGGKLNLIKPKEVEITEFDFTNTFDYFIGASGKIIGRDITYYAGLVNYAIMHISFSSFGNQTYDELILTRFQKPKQDPFYVRHNNIVVGGGVFILTYIYLQFGQVIMDKMKSLFYGNTIPPSQAAKKKNE